MTPSYLGWQRSWDLERRLKSETWSKSPFGILYSLQLEVIFLKSWKKFSGCLSLGLKKKKVLNVKHENIIS